MDISMIADHLVLVVILACLVIGYVIKHAHCLKFINNDDIPLILSVVGALINLLVSGVSVESIVYGAFMGLASTGCHQAFKRFIEEPKINTKG